MKLYRYSSYCVPISSHISKASGRYGAVSMPRTITYIRYWADAIPHHGPALDEIIAPRSIRNGGVRSMLHILYLFYFFFSFVIFGRRASHPRHRTAKTK